MGMSGVEQDVTVFDADFNRSERTAHTRSGNTHTVFDLEEGAMGSTENVILFHGQEGVRFPVERCSLMRAQIHIGKNVIAFADDKKPVSYTHLTLPTTPYV